MCNVFNGVEELTAFMTNIILKKFLGGSKDYDMLDIYYLALFHEAGVLDWGKLVVPDDFEGMLVSAFMNCYSDFKSPPNEYKDRCTAVSLWVKNLSFGASEVLNHFMPLMDVLNLSYMYQVVRDANVNADVAIRTYVAATGAVEEFLSVLQNVNFTLNASDFYDGLPGEYQLGVVL